MASQALDRARKYRAIAANLRASAAHAKSDDIRAGLLTIAEGYARLAAKLESGCFDMPAEIEALNIDALNHVPDCNADSESRR